MYGEALLRLAPTKTLASLLREKVANWLVGAIRRSVSVSGVSSRIPRRTY
jgi:hypothetical protein